MYIGMLLEIISQKRNLEKSYLVSGIKKSANTFPHSEPWRIALIIVASKNGFFQNLKEFLKSFT
jgi:hypothetical protein